MKNELPFPNLFRCAALTFCVALSTPSSPAQVMLTGTNYHQNFNAISNGLPAGWSVRTNATAGRLGQPAPFRTSAKSWSDNPGEFGNCAGTLANCGTNYLGAEPALPVQSGTTNRCVAIRQTSVFGDPGAAFVLQIASTTGFSDLTFSLDLNLLKTNGYSTTWIIDYAVGNAPDAFTPLGTFSDPGVFGATQRSFTLGTDADNQTNNVWIRVAALNGATGTGSRDTFGIDNFDLNYAQAAPATVLAIPLFIQADGQSAILRWNDSTFALQAAPTPVGTFTNVPGATSPFTNTLDDPAKFFRLVN